LRLQRRNVKLLACGPKFQNVVAAALVAVPLAAPGSGDDTASAARKPAGAAPYRILFTSDRDGGRRAYSMLPDGSRMTPLLAAGRKLVPIAYSRDRRTIAFVDGKDAVYVGRANGTGVRRVVARGETDGGALSYDGKLLAVTRGNGIWIVGTNGRGLRRLTKGEGDGVPWWAPDGKAIVYDHGYQDRQGGDHSAIVVQPLHGKPRVLARASFDPNDEEVGDARWSPDGRWIDYVYSNDDRSIWFLVRPDGTHRHRSPAQAGFAWSSDGKQLAYFAGAHGEDVGIVGVDGRGRRRLHLTGLASISDLMWSPDARRIVLGAGAKTDDPEQLWIVGADGKGLRRLTSRGANGPFGWTRLAPVQPEARPVTPAERVTAAYTVTTTAPVAALSADGPNVAFVVHERRTDCDHVAVWTPDGSSIRRFGPLPAPCPAYTIPIDGVALAGSRVAWTVDPGGSDCQVGLRSATFAAPEPVEIAAYKCSAADFHVSGDGDLLVFDNGPTLERIGAGHEDCEPGFDMATICTALRSGDHSAPIDSVSGGLIAIREPGAVAVVDEGGRLVRVFPFTPDDVSAARLEGGSLVVWRFGVLEVYDVASGALELSRPLPTGYRLADVDGGIAVLVGTDSIRLLRLSDGRSQTLTPSGGSILADLEPPGLYYSYATPDGGGRVVFVSRSQLFPARSLLAARPSSYRILLSSDRDGRTRAYSMRPDGSRLTPLLPRGRALIPEGASGDGTTVAYRDSSYVTYVSRADGTRLRRVTREAFEPALSRDGKLLAFRGGDGESLFVVGSDGRRRRLTHGPGDVYPAWSPDAKAVVFMHLFADPGQSVVVQSLSGTRRVLDRGGSPLWSPDGRWIAYSGAGNALYAIRPDGGRRHRVAGGRSEFGAFAWSPDARTIAFALRSGDVALVGPHGGGLKRLGLHGVSVAALAWSPDGLRLALQGTDEQIWIVGRDGHGFRRLTNRGRSGLLGWTRLAPKRSPVKPLPPSERVAGARTVVTRTRVGELSADGSRVAFAVGPTRADCDHVVIWTPAAKSLVRLGRRAPCSPGNDAGSIYDLELAGSRTAWSSVISCGNTCEVLFSTATLAARSPVGVADDGADHNDDLPDFHAHGDGGLLVFDDGSRLERIGVGRGGCTEHGDYSPRICTTLRSGAHAAGVDSVSGGLIAVREPDAVAILDDQGKLVRVFPFGPDEVDRAVLDGGRLVVARAGVLEVYDARSGRAELQRPLPAGYRLTDVDGGVAVLVSGAKIVLLRLADGRSSKLAPGRGPVSAELEPPGLYYSYAIPGGGGRVVFVPRAEIVRRLDGGAR
jgi:Tol biopolymer transport system component